MKSLSRRQLAIYGIEQLQAGANPSKIAERLTAELYLSKRTRQTEMLIDDIFSELEKRGVLCRAEVATAKPMSKTTYEGLKRFISDLTGVNKLQLETKTEPELIGGARINTANLEWDSSVKQKLSSLASASFSEPKERARG